MYIRPAYLIQPVDVHKQTGDVLIFLLQFLKHETILFHHQKQGEGRLSRILALGPNNPKGDETPEYDQLSQH